MLVGAAALPKVTRVLTPTAFARDRHRFIYESVLAVAREGADPDLVLVIADLAASGRLDEAGGAAYITGLVDGLPCVDNVVHYARYIREREVLRRAERRRP